MQVARRPQMELLNRGRLAVVHHNDQPGPKRTCLIHPTATRGRSDLSEVCVLHLVVWRHTEVVEPIQCASSQHTHGGRRGEPLLDGQVRPIIVNNETADAVVRSDTEGNTGRIAKEPARLGFRQKCLRFHRNFLRSAHLTVGHGGVNDERVGISFDSGVESLVGADDDGESLAKFGVGTAIFRRPVRMFAEKAKTTRYEYFQ